MNVRRRIGRVGSIAALVVLWALAASSGLIRQPDLAPWAVLAALVEQLPDPSFWDQVIVSAGRVYVSFLVALVIAVPLGLAIGWNRVFADLTFPSLELLRPLPPIAWFPALLLISPSSRFSIMYITFLGAFYPILLNAIEGVQSLEAEFSQAAQSLGAAPFQTFRHVIFPGALPSIYTGAVTGMGLAWVNLVAAELIAGSGLGYSIWTAYTSGTYGNIVVGMIAIGVLGYISSAAIRRIGAGRLPWMQGRAA